MTIHLCAMVGWIHASQRTSLILWYAGASPCEVIGKITDREKSPLGRRNEQSLKCHSFIFNTFVKELVQFFCKESENKNQKRILK